MYTLDELWKESVFTDKSYLLLTHLALKGIEIRCFFVVVVVVFPIFDGVIIRDGHSLLLDINAGVTNVTPQI